MGSLIGKNITLLSISVLQYVHMYFHWGAASNQRLEKQETVLKDASLIPRDSRIHVVGVIDRTAFYPPSTSKAEVPLSKAHNPLKWLQTALMCVCPLCFQVLLDMIPVKVFKMKVVLC